MADESKIGKPWQDRDLDVIVADYFEMLLDDLSGKPYVKSKHSAAVMAQTGRTHRSVEFKHQWAPRMRAGRRTPDDWLIYRVHQFAREPRIFTVVPPLAEALRLIPESWRACL